MITIMVNDEIIQEANNIVDGVYKPLRGFLDEENFWSVTNNYRLADGSIWPMPIVLDIDDDQYKVISRLSEFIIEGEHGERFHMSNISVYEIDKLIAVEKIFGTVDSSHPGVMKFLKTKKRFVGGVVERVSRGMSDVHPHYLTPSESREIFRKNKWEYIVAFQTRNPPHRSHEFLQKHALEQVDALFVQPVIGSKKSGDVKDEYIIGAYEILLEKYYPKDKAILGTFHTFMRYAGPREAVFHTLVRRNFGCTHMIIGRDHAGVGDYYDSYASHRIFDQFTFEELGISVLKYQNASFCSSCGDIRFEGECECNVSERLNISGTKLREMIKNGENIPEGFMRKEVSDYLFKERKNLFC